MKLLLSKIIRCNISLTTFRTFLQSFAYIFNSLSCNLYTKILFAHGVKIFVLLLENIWKLLLLQVVAGPP